MQTIITTVGTSLLYNRDDKSQNKRPWAGGRFGSEYPQPNEIAQWLQTADPCQASAEIHTWYRLNILDETTDVKVVLVHSQTKDGEFCADRLKEYAKSRGLQAATQQVNELSYSDPETFNRGLGRFVRLLAETIRAARTQGQVAIAATGGFKAEIAVANLVGTLFGTPVHYIYEQFEQLITIEPIPIVLDPDWLGEGAGQAFLQKLVDNDCLYRKDLDSFLRADSKLELLLESVEENGEEMVCPNLLGELAAQLVKRPPVDWPVACDTLPDDKNQLEGTEHHRPKVWKRIVDRLAESRFVQRFRYDGGSPRDQGVYTTRDNDTDIHVVIADDQAVLGLRVETTATNAEQRRLVINALKSKLKL